MAKAPLHVGFLLVSGFMMASYVLAADALRLANWRAGRRLFTWDVRTADGKAAEANNGMIVAPDVQLEASPPPDAIFICAGFSAEQGFTKPVFRWLRGAERRKAVLGGWDTGPIILAEAGLMDGRQMAIHWQAVPAVRERYPRVRITSDRCQIEKRFFTGPGGVSTFDLIVGFIEQKAGTQVARMVVKSANREASLVSEPWPPVGSASAGAIPLQLSRIISLMEKKIADPPSVSRMAALSGLSERRLYRLFQAQFGMPPKRFYANLRLERARDLLRQTELPVTEIAAETGFKSLSRFSQAFRSCYRESPTSARKRPRWLQVENKPAVGERMIRTDL